jgi:penicillin-binding protein 1A
VFANGGYRVEPYFIQRIETADGKSVFEAAPRFACDRCLEPKPELIAPDLLAPELAAGEGTPPAAMTPRIAPTDASRWGDLSYLDEQALAPQAISPQNSYVMTDMMADVVRRGTGARAMQLKRSDLAGKTGTTNDGRDAWFCGFNASLVGTAWVGFDQERPLGRGEQGSRTALPIWIYFMAEALQGTPEQRRAPPPGIVTMRISAETGLAARPDDANAMFETFIDGHLPPVAEGLNPEAPLDNTPVPQPSSDEPLF